MNWLLGATKAWAVIGACVFGGGLAGLLSDATAAMPSLTQGQLAPVPVVAVVGLLPAVMLAWGWSLLPLRALAGAVRTVSVILLVMVMTCCAVFSAAALVTGGSGAMLESGRNAVGLMGLALLGQRAWGERGAVTVPVAYLIAAFAVGRPSGGPTPSWWAWVLLDSSSGTAFIVAGACLLFGLMMTPRLPRVAVVRGGVT